MSNKSNIFISHARWNRFPFIEICIRRQNSVLRNLSEETQRDNEEYYLEARFIFGTLR